jgi:3D (Asp-Asp-Asp) domain-containing protein
MKNLVRGALILSILSLFVVFIYAQTKTDSLPDIANDSLSKIDNLETFLTAEIKISNTNSNTDNTTEDKEQIKDKENKESKENKDNEQISEEVEGSDKKLVTKTGSSRATRGVNRGGFVATAYCLRGRTASGTNVRRGVIAADPRVLPLGTRVALGAGGLSGDYVVADTGGRIKGKKIDIWMASCADARRFGRRTVNVTVLN